MSIEVMDLTRRPVAYVVRCGPRQVSDRGVARAGVRPAPLSGERCEVRCPSRLVTVQE